MQTKTDLNVSPHKVFVDSQRVRFDPRTGATLSQGAKGFSRSELGLAEDATGEELWKESWKAPTKKQAEKTLAQRETGNGGAKVNRVTEKKNGAKSSSSGSKSSGASPSSSASSKRAQPAEYEVPLYHPRRTSTRDEAFVDLRKV